MFDGITETKFGHVPVAVAFRPEQLHFYDGNSTLREVEWEPPIPVLDQEDLYAQGIDTSKLIPGAQKVPALGSCTCNAGTGHIAERATAAWGDKATVLSQIGLSATDAVQDEEYAIVLYHDTTDLTGDPASEWPPTDCGSNGVYVCKELEKRGLISGWKTAGGMHNVASLLQKGSVMMGGPWFKAWMQPDSGGFVDGDGGVEALMEAVSSGVAGGHETLMVALERLVLDNLGYIDLGKSWFRVRNSWSTAFGDQGEYRVHLSTLELLGRYFQYVQAVPKAA